MKYYHSVEQQADIIYTVDSEEYKDKIKNSDCTLFWAEYGSDYKDLRCGIIENGNIQLWSDKKVVAAEGKFRNRKSHYYISSSKDACSIVIDDEEYAVNSPGLNIVVYDEISRQVIDSVCINSEGILERKQLLGT